MKRHLVKINSIQHIAHDVLQIVTEKPEQYKFLPGQGVEVSINKDVWKGEKRPFIFTSLPECDYLEFTVKAYPLSSSFSRELLQLNNLDELILHDVFGSIVYKGEGIFIAGGIGVAAFMCILRHLKEKNKMGNNKLILANKTKDEIIHAQELKNLLGKNLINVLFHENAEGCVYGRITEDFLKTHIKGTNKKVYMCGPPPMMNTIEKQLSNLGIDKNAIMVAES
jgi:ferredoxin-NADP reductase